MKVCLPLVGELALCAEEVDVVLELELEDEVLLNVVLCGGHVHGVAQQGQARQREVVLQQVRVDEISDVDQDPELCSQAGYRFGIIDPNTNPDPNFLTVAMNTLK
jgi:hypothetical protein